VLGSGKTYYGLADLRLLVCITCSIVLRLKLLTLVRFDTSSFILEHYDDGDSVDDKYPTNRSEASPDGLHFWGE
jgi:hypothetical protein